MHCLHCHTMLPRWGRFAPALRFCPACGTALRNDWAWLALLCVLLAGVPALRGWAGWAALLGGLLGGRQARRAAGRGQWVARVAVGLGGALVVLVVLPASVSWLEEHWQTLQARRQVEETRRQEEVARQQAEQQRLAAEQRQRDEATRQAEQQHLAEQRQRDEDAQQQAEQQRQAEQRQRDEDAQQQAEQQRQAEQQHRQEEARKQIQQAQTTLSTLGLYPGTIDGLLGPRTQAALRQYQAAHGLPVTGVLDEATWKALSLLNLSFNHALDSNDMEKIKKYITEEHKNMKSTVKSLKNQNRDAPFFKDDLKYYEYWLNGLQEEESEQYKAAIIHYQKSSKVDRYEMASYTVLLPLGRALLLDNQPKMARKTLREYITKAKGELSGEDQLWSLSKEGKIKLQQDISFAEWLMSR